MRTDIWTAFQHDTLSQLGIQTLEEASRIAIKPEQVPNVHSELEISAVASNDGVERIAVTIDSIADDLAVTNNVTKSKADTQKAEVKSAAKAETSMSVVEVGQREAWKTAIHAAHGCLITGRCELANGVRVLILTESPKLTVENDSATAQKAALAESKQAFADFADDVLATFTADMLASIGLVDVAFSRWQNALNYLPYERRDDAEPDLARFQTDFAELITTTSPSHVLAFGQLTAKLVLKSSASIGKLRGSAHALNIAGQSLQAFALYHPAFLLRAPTHKRTQWQDLKLAYRSIHQREA